MADLRHRVSRLEAKARQTQAQQPDATGLSVAEVLAEVQALLQEQCPDLSEADLAALLADVRILAVQQGAVQDDGAGTQ